MEKERLEKVRRFWQLDDEFWNIRKHYFRSSDVLNNEVVRKDLLDLMGEVGNELDSLREYLYPLPPKDLMEDVKKRIEAYKLAKVGTGNRIPPLTFKQKVWLIFRREGHEKAK